MARFVRQPPGRGQATKERADLPQRAATLPSEVAVRAMGENFNARVAGHWRRPQLRVDVVPGFVPSPEPVRVLVIGIAATVLARRLAVPCPTRTSVPAA